MAAISLVAAKARNADTLTKQVSLRPPLRSSRPKGYPVEHSLSQPRRSIALAFQSIDIPAELLSIWPPASGAHIALTSDYLLNEHGPLERFRPIRANRFNPNNLAFP